MNIKEKSMDDIITCIKRFCEMSGANEYGEVVAVARGIVGAELDAHPDKSYTVSEISRMLDAIHGIVWKDIGRKKAV